MNKGNIKKGETWNQELGRERSDPLQHSGGNTLVWVQEA